MDNKRKSKKQPAGFQRKPLITALEPRILLDGAAVATTAEMTTDVAFQQSQSGDDSGFGIASVNNPPVFADASSEDDSGSGSGSNNEPVAGELISTYEITEGPSDIPLALKDGETVEVGFYLSNKSSSYVDGLVNFYNAENNMSSVVFDYGTTLDNHSIDVQLLYISMPDDQFTTSEIQVLSDFLDKGGRIFFFGEHNGFSPTENANLSKAITDLGGNITILGGSYSQDRIHTNTDGNMNLNNSPLVSGVTRFNTAAFAQLQIDSNISKTVITDDYDRIVVADQALSKGRVTVLADINPVYSELAQNATFFRNVAIDSLNAVDLVADGGNPNEEFDVVSGLVETNAGLSDTGTVILTDVDTADTVTVTHTVAAVQQNSNSETISASAFAPSNSALQAMLSIAPDPALTDSETTRELIWTFDSGNEAFDYLKADEKLVLTYTLTADDGNGGTGTQDVTVTINGTDDKPQHNLPVTQSVNEDQPLVFSNANSNSLSLGITDDEQVTTTLSVDASVGTLLITNAGSLSISGNGTTTVQFSGTRAEINATLQGLTFRPAANKHGPVSFTLATSDGVTTQTDTVSVNIQPANDAPETRNDTATAIESGGTFNASPGNDATGNVLSNDTDVDIATGDSLSVNAITFGSTTVIVTTGNAATIAGDFGTLEISAEGTYRYIIDESNPDVEALRASGDQLTETFIYRMQDSGDPLGENTTALEDTGQLTITLDGRNDAPVANNDTGLAVESGGTLNETLGSKATGNVLDNDTDVETDAGDQLVVTEINFGENTGNVVSGSATSIEGRYGTLRINDDGSYEYVIDESNAEVEALRASGDQLTETFTYQIQDNADSEGNVDVALTDTAQLTITIDGRNDAPVANNDTGLAVESGGTLNGTTGSNATGNVLDNDTDVETSADDRFAVTAITFGDNTETIQTGSGTSINGLYGTLQINADGSYVYEIDESNPDVEALRISGQQLTERFVYRIQDNADLSGSSDIALTDTSELVITLDGRNDQPVALDTNADEEWDFGKAYTKDISLLFNDVDALSNGEDLDYTISGMPAGLEYDAETGLITGAPTQSGTFIITLLATDQLGTSIGREYLLEVIPPAQESSEPQTTESTDIPPPSVDTTSVDTPLSDLPDGLVDPLGSSNDSSDDSGFVEGSTAPVTFEFEAENTEVDGRVTVMASVDVNVTNSGDVVFTDEQLQAFDVVAMRIAGIDNSAEQLQISIMDNIQDEQVYTGTLGDDTPLPDWITIDSESGKVSAVPPEDEDEITVRVKATGDDGNIRILEIKLNLQELRDNNNAEAADNNQAAFVPLSEQVTEQVNKQTEHGEQLVAALTPDKD